MSDPNLICKICENELEVRGSRTEQQITVVGGADRGAAEVICAH
jgi:hypothetical protein